MKFLPPASADHSCPSPRCAVTYLAPRGHESGVGEACRGVTRPHPKPFQQLFLFFLPPFFLSTRRDAETFWKIRSRKLSKEAAPRFPARLCVAIHSSEFPPSTPQAQSHPSLTWQQGRAGSLYVASTHWVTCADASQEACPQKEKYSEQPLRFCFLCGLYWCLLLAYILGGGVTNYSERSRYFWSREAMCVSDYCHFVLLSEKSLGIFLLVCFSEEFYNIPTDLMFDSENIYKF